MKDVNRTIEEIARKATDFMDRHPGDPVAPQMAIVSTMCTVGLALLERLDRAIAVLEEIRDARQTRH